MKLRKPKSLFKESKLNWSDAKATEAGRDILEEVMHNPKSFRMGDIFYKIQEKIDKNSKIEPDD